MEEQTQTSVDTAQTPPVEAPKAAPTGPAHAVEIDAERWHRTRGSLILPDAEPEKVAEFLARAGVVARLLWDPATPHRVAMVLGTDAHGAVATTAKARGKAKVAPGFQAGHGTEALAKEIANALRADVRLGGANANALPEGYQQPAAPQPSGAPRRTVEITPMISPMIPLMSATENLTLRFMDHTPLRRLLLIDHSEDEQAEDGHWYRYLSDFPVVELEAAGQAQRLRLIRGPEADDWDTHTLDLRQVVVFGFAGMDEAAVNPQLAAQVKQLVGREVLASALAQAVPGTSEAALAQALSLTGNDGFVALAKALNLPEQVQEFLAGKREADQVAGVETHEPRGLANAMGRSVDIALSDPDSTGSALWTSYHKVAVESPWAIRLFAAGEAALGATLLARSVPSGGRRWRWWMSLIGVGMLFDSVAEVSLAKYLGLREERYRQERTR